MRPRLAAGGEAIEAANAVALAANKNAAQLAAITNARARTAERVLHCIIILPPAC